MNTEFYKPAQGDTAAKVAEGYDNNFKALEAGKVDKAEGKGLSSNDYTTDEKAKLSGIEAAANNYTHPDAHSADMITDTADKVVMTATEREKLAQVILQVGSIGLMLDKINGEEV